MSRKLFLAAIPAALAVSGNAFAQNNEMREVVVTSNRTQETMRELSSNVTVVTEAEIKASPATTLADIMTQQGFLVATSGDTSSIQIRGYGNLTLPSEPENTVLMLINGRRVGSANLALMGLANVERVEIIRGPSAVQYGSSALGGVVNVITKRGEANKPYASLEAGMGSDGLSRQKAAFGGAIGAFDYSVGLTNYNRGDVTTAEFGRWYHSEMDRNLLGSVDLGYSFSKDHRVGISHYEGDVMSNLSTNNAGIRQSNTSATAFNTYRKRTESTTLSYNGSTSDKAFDWSTSYTTGRESNQTVTTNYTGFVESQMMNAQAGYNGSLFSLSGGVDTLEYRQYASDAPAKPKMADTGAYFASKLRLLDERLIFSLGGRYDRYTNTDTASNSYSDDHFGGSYGVAWLPVEGLKLRTNYAEGFKMPSPGQLGGNPAWSIIANPNLRPETGKTWEIGADVSWKSLTTSLTYFHSKYDNKIIWADLGGWTGQYQNIKAATLAGVEGSARYDLGKALGQSYSLSPYGNFTWLKTRSSGDPSQYVAYNGSLVDTLPNTPEWMFSYGLDFNHPGYKVKSRVSANTYGTLLTKDYSQSGSPYIKRPSGTVVNMSLDKELTSLGSNAGVLSLRAEINNIFDGKNEMYWGFPGQGRNYYAGLRYDYK